MATNAPKGIRQKIAWDNEVIEIVNILPEDFDFRWDGTDYAIKSGEVKSYPRFIAIHAAKHMVDRHIIDTISTSQINNAKLRADVTEQIWVKKEGETTEEVVEVKEEVKEVTPTPKTDTSINEMTKNDLVKRLTTLGGKWDPKDNKEDLKRKIKNASKE